MVTNDDATTELHVEGIFNAQYVYSRQAALSEYDGMTLDD